MRKKLLAIIAMAAMVVTMIPSMAFAADNVAFIGEVGYPSLQAALEAAESNATIELKNGEHEGNLVIDKAVTIVGESKEGTIIVGTEKGGNLIHAKENIKLENLTIDGKKSELPPKHVSQHGVYAEAGLNVNNVDVLNIGCSADLPLCGCQTGIAIYVDTTNSNSGAVSITNVNLKDFQKAGIVSKTSGDVKIENANIVGAGETKITAQNGIQINNSKNAKIDNSKIENINYDGDVDACGILLVDGANVWASDVVFNGVEAEVKCYADSTESIAYIKDGCDYTTITEDEVVEEEQHSYDTIKFDEKNHWKECECGGKIDVEEHAFGKWEVVKEPTADEKGQMKRVCEKCGFEEFVDTTLVDNGSTDPAEKDETAKTGDDTNLVLPVGLALVALLGIGGVVATRRRHN